jgi:FkbM family methyltransferase
VRWPKSTPENFSGCTVSVHELPRTSVKQRIRKLIPRPVARLSRFLLRVADPYATVSYAQEGEDIILLRLFASAHQGIYIDVGAHDPYRFSNTCALYLRGWHGINIDADSDAIAAFRRERPRDINLSIGVLQAPGKSTLYVFSDPALNTFDEALAREREKLPGYRLAAKREVATERLETILAKYLPEGSTIDVLNIDAEGRDLEVLRSNDWRRYRPRCVLVEARIGGLDKLGSDETNIFLAEEGYRLYAKTVNTLIYVRRDEAGN